MPAKKAPPKKDEAVLETPSAGAARIQDELEELAKDAKAAADCNIEESEMRIGVASRKVLEYALLAPVSRTKLTYREKCDIALRSITTLEGSRQEITWRDEMRNRPKRKTMEALAAERKKVTDRILKAATRKKEVQLAQAEEALKALGEEPKN